VRQLLLQVDFQLVDDADELGTGNGGHVIDALDDRRVLGLKIFVERGDKAFGIDRNLLSGVLVYPENAPVKRSGSWLRTSDRRRPVWVGPSNEEVRLARRGCPRR
jgi:hypothetical protein